MTKPFKDRGPERIFPARGFYREREGKLSMRRFTNAWIQTIALLVMLGWASTALAGLPVIVDWDDATVTPGNMGGITVMLLDATGLSIIYQDLTGPDYAAAPVTANTEVASYDVRSNWTATFSQPVQNLLLYAVNWRGNLGGPGPDSITYEFDHPFTILSGMSNSTVSGGNTILSIPKEPGIFEDGILQFAGPVSSLSVITNTDNQSGQSLTFGFIPTTAGVPTLSEWGLIAMAGILGIVGFMAIRRRKVTA